MSTEERTVEETKKKEEEEESGSAGMLLQHAQKPLFAYEDILATYPDPLSNRGSGYLGSLTENERAALHQLAEKLDE